MSATPEQIAERLEAMLGMNNVTPRIPNLPRTLMADALEVIRAQSEREKVLVDALKFYRDAWQWDGVSSPLEPSGDLLDDRGQRARAALAGAR